MFRLRGFLVYPPKVKERPGEAKTGPQEGWRWRWRWHGLMDLTALMRRTLKPAALDGGVRQAAVWLPGNSAGVEVITSKAPAEARTNDRPAFNLRKGKLGGNKREGGGWGEPQGRSRNRFYIRKYWEKPSNERPGGGTQNSSVKHVTHLMRLKL